MANKDNKVAGNDDEVTGSMVARTLVGLLLPGLDALWGFLKGSYYFFKAMMKGESYFHAGLQMPPPRSVEGQDRQGKTATVIYWLSRVAVCAVTAFCVLGFIAALFAPMPGTAPLAALGLFTIAKGFGIYSTIAMASGITSAVGIATRFICAAVGSFFDFLEHREIMTPKIWAKSIFMIGFFGEATIHARPIVQAIGRFFENCWCCFSLKRKQERDNIHDMDEVSSRAKKRTVGSNKVSSAARTMSRLSGSIKSSESDSKEENDRQFDPNENSKKIIKKVFKGMEQGADADNRELSNVAGSPEPTPAPVLAEDAIDGTPQAAGCSAAALGDGDVEVDVEVDVEDNAEPGMQRRRSSSVSSLP